MGGGKSSGGGGGGGGYIGRRYDASGQFAQTKGQQSVVAKSEGGGENADRGFSTSSSGKGVPGSSGYSGKELSQMAQTAGVAGLTTAATGYGIPLSALAALAGAGYERHQINKAHEREFQGLNPAPPGTQRFGPSQEARKYSTPRVVSSYLADDGTGSDVGGFDAGGYTSQDAASARGGKL